MTFMMVMQGFLLLIMKMTHYVSNVYISRLLKPISSSL